MADPNLTPEGSQGSTAQVAVSEPVKEFLRIDENTVFNSPQDAIKAYKEGTMRHSEYKKGMEEYKSNSTRFENERAQYNRERAEWEEKNKKYKSFDDIITKNPRAYQQMLAIMKEQKGGLDPDEIKKIVDQQYGPQFKKIEEEDKRKRTAEERDKHYADLTSQYPDFNKDAVQQTWDKLMGPEATMRDFLEVLHYASKGRGVDPAKIKEEVIDNLEKNKAARIPTARGAAPSADIKPEGESIRDIAERLKAKKRGG
jgi:hypothetical protein